MYVSQTLKNIMKMLKIHFYDDLTVNLEDLAVNSMLPCRLHI